MTEVARSGCRPTADIADARVTDFARFVEQRTGAPMPDYHSLWQWSVDDPAAFWGALWDYFELGDRPDGARRTRRCPVRGGSPVCRLNYVDQIVRNARTDRPAILHVSEDGRSPSCPGPNCSGAPPLSRTTLRAHGVAPVTGSSAICPIFPRRSSRSWRPRASAPIWSACGQDYSRQGRTGPARPARAGRPGHRRRLSFGGKTHDKRDDVAALRAGLPTLRATVSPLVGESRRTPGRATPMTRRRTRHRRQSISTIRCGFCSPRAPPGCRRASCTDTAASCSNI